MRFWYRVALKAAKVDRSLRIATGVRVVGAWAAAGEQEGCRLGESELQASKQEVAAWVRAGKQLATAWARVGRVAASVQAGKAAASVQVGRREAAASARWASIRERARPCW